MTAQPRGRLGGPLGRGGQGLVPVFADGVGYGVVAGHGVAAGRDQLQVWRCQRSVTLDPGGHARGRGPGVSAADRWARSEEMTKVPAQRSDRPLPLRAVRT